MKHNCDPHTFLAFLGVLKEKTAAMTFLIERMEIVVRSICKNEKPSKMVKGRKSKK